MLAVAAASPLNAEAWGAEAHRLIVEVHQPLHAGFADDRGGNHYQLQAFGRGTNLHAVWDSALIRNWPGGEQALRTAVNTEMAHSVAHETAARWAEESCAVGVEERNNCDFERISCDPERIFCEWRPVGGIAAKLADRVNESNQAEPRMP